MKKYLILSVRLIFVAVSLVLGNDAVKAQEQTDSIPLPGYEQLEDVVVTANKAIIKSDGATVTYNVSDDPTSKGITVLDMLRKVPGVTVDSQDNIRLNGQSDFKILVNGHEDASLSQYASQILKMLPAEAIERIEVINEPGAKYDAEGSGGFLNLIMAQQAESTDGYTGTLTLSASNRDLSPSFAFRFKKKNVTASMNLSYNRNLMNQNHDTHTKTEYFNQPGASIVDNVFNQNVSYDFVGANAALSWEPTSNNLFTIDINVHNVDGDIHKSLSCTTAYDNAYSTLWMQQTYMSGNMKNLSLSSQGSFKHSFNTSGHDLILTYLFNYGRNPLQIIHDYIMSEGMPSADEIDQLQINFDRSHTAQADYSIPIDGHNVIEAGMKGVFFRNSALGHTKTIMEGLQFTDFSNLGQQKDVSAAYASYSGTFGHILVKAGLRYEHTRMAIKYVDDAAKDFTKRLNDPVPNAALTWAFSPVHNIRLAYQMRIARPSIQQVNPYRMSIFDNDIRYGNPDLESQRENKISLTYTQFAGVLGGNIGLDYSITDNVISDFVYSDNGLTYQTYENLGKKNEIGLNGFLNWNIVTGTSLSLGGRISRYQYKSIKQNIDFGRFIGNYYANFNTMLPGKLQLSAFGGQGTGWASAQHTNSGWYYYGFGLTRKFLANDALSVGLNAGNFLTKNTWLFMTTITSDMTQHTTYKAESWRVGVNLSWTFGQLKSDVKKINVNAGLDDTVKSENHSGGAF